MKKLILTTAICTIMACPAFADNENITASNNDCVNDTLTTYSGSATLEADWSPNPVTVTYYSGDSVYGNAGQCTYDDTLTLPSAPSQPGYTFAGWKVKAAAAPSQPQQTTITLSSLYDSGIINIFASKSLNPGEYCEGSSGWDAEEDNYAWYGTAYEGSCSDSEFSGLNNGEWTVTMPNGNKVKGTARCSTVNGTYAQTGNPTDDLDLNDLANSGARYCWCKVTSGNTGSGYQSVASSSWVFRTDYGDADDCASYCATDCADDVCAHGSDDFRRAVFGVSQ